MTDAWQVQRFNNRLERVRLQAKVKEEGVFKVKGWFSRGLGFLPSADFDQDAQYVADVMKAAMAAIHAGCTFIQIEKEKKDSAG